MEVSARLVPAVTTGQPRPTIASTIPAAAGTCGSRTAAGTGAATTGRAASLCGVRSKNEFLFTLLYRLTIKRSAGC